MQDKDHKSCGSVMTMTTRMCICFCFCQSSSCGVMITIKIINTINALSFILKKQQYNTTKNWTHHGSRGQSRATEKCTLLKSQEHKKKRNGNSRWKSTFYFNRVVLFLARALSTERARASPFEFDRFFQLLTISHTFQFH